MVEIARDAHMFRYPGALTASSLWPYCRGHLIWPCGLPETESELLGLNLWESQWPWAFKMGCEDCSRNPVPFIFIYFWRSPTCSAMVPHFQQPDHVFMAFCLAFDQLGTKRGYIFCGQKKTHLIMHGPMLPPQLRCFPRLSLVMPSYLNCTTVRMAACPDWFRGTGTGALRSPPDAEHQLRQCQWLMQEPLSLGAECGYIWGLASNGTCCSPFPQYVMASSSCFKLFFMQDDLYILRRIGAVQATIKQLHPLWTQACTSVNWRLRVFDAVIKSKILYGLESIQLTQAEQSRLDALQMKTLRKILGVPTTFVNREWTNQKVIDTLEHRFKYSHTKLSTRWKNNKTRLLGHILRAQHDDPMREVVFVWTWNP